MTLGPREWSPRWPSEVIEAVARALFVSAWADQEERDGRSHSGQELMDVAPPTITEADRSAIGLMASTELLNGMSFTKMYAQALKAGGLEDSFEMREEFGHLLAMHALGSGVGLGDTFGKHGLRVPSVEFYLPG